MDQAKIWDFFQNDQEIGDLVFNAEARYRYLIRQIEPERDILNIGVGRGGLEKLLIENKNQVSCLDPNEKSIRNLRSRFGLGNRARVGFSQAIPFDDDSFDIVVMSEVIEHLTDTVLEETLTNIHRVLRPGGKFIGTVPAEQDLRNDQVVCPDCGKVFHRWGHVQSFSEERLRSMLSALFSDLTVGRHFFGNFRLLNWKGRVSCAVKKLMVVAKIKGTGETFFFSAERTR